jgi:hypothetical protein
MEERGALAGLFDRMLELRQGAARNAGFANFRDYIFPAKFRFDYTPADCERFHAAVERTAAPAVARIMEHRRQRLGLDALRPWDLAVDPYRASPLRPFETVDENDPKSGAALPSAFCVEMRWPDTKSWLGASMRNITYCAAGQSSLPTKTWSTAIRWKAARAEPAGITTVATRTIQRNHFTFMTGPPSTNVSQQLLLGKCGAAVTLFQLRGSPSTRCATILRCTSLVPPAMVIERS